MTTTLVLHHFNVQHIYLTHPIPSTKLWGIVIKPKILIDCKQKMILLKYQQLTSWILSHMATHTILVSVLNSKIFTIYRTLRQKWETMVAILSNLTGCINDCLPIPWLFTNVGNIITVYTYCKKKEIGGDAKIIYATAAAHSQSPYIKSLPHERNTV